MAADGLRVSARLLCTSCCRRVVGTRGKARRASRRAGKRLKMLHDSKQKQGERAGNGGLGKKRNEETGRRMARRPRAIFYRTSGQQPSGKRGEEGGRPSPALTESQAPRGCGHRTRQASATRSCYACTTPQQPSTACPVPVCSLGDLIARHGINTRRSSRFCGPVCGDQALDDRPATAVPSPPNSEQRNVRQGGPLFSLNCIIQSTSLVPPVSPFPHRFVASPAPILQSLFYTHVAPYSFRPPPRRNVRHQKCLPGSARRL